jgi:hypothetical protein
MKSAEVQLFMAIAAKHGLTVFKSDSDRHQTGLPECGNQRWKDLLPGTRLVARTSSGGACPTADEEYVWDAPGSSAIACADFHVDGGSWLCSSKQRKVHFHEA